MVNVIVDITKIMYYYIVKTNEHYEKYKILNDVIPNLTNNEIEMLDKFYELLIKENDEFNLTSITDFDMVLHKHFYDSLIFTKEINLTNKSVVDVGTGCGVPGIILKICFPSIELYLVESSFKKTTFLKKVIKELKLNNVFVINSRVEDFSKNNSEKFDIVVSRAMARLNILIEVCSQLLKIGGMFIALKAKKYISELSELDNKEKELGYSFQKEQTFKNDILGIRANLFFIKNEKTPSKYPRLYSIIKNKPLGNQKLIKENKIMESKIEE